MPVTKTTNSGRATGRSSNLIQFSETDNDSELSVAPKRQTLRNVKFSDIQYSVFADSQIPDQSIPSRTRDKVRKSLKNPELERADSSGYVYKATSQDYHDLFLDRFRRGKLSRPMTSIFRSSAQLPNMIRLFEEHLDENASKNHILNLLGDIHQSNHKINLLKKLPKWVLYPLFYVAKSNFLTPDKIAFLVQSSNTDKQFIDKFLTEIFVVQWGRDLYEQSPRIVEIKRRMLRRQLFSLKRIFPDSCLVRDTDGGYYEINFYGEVVRFNFFNGFDANEYRLTRANAVAKLMYGLCRPKAKQHRKLKEQLSRVTHFDELMEGLDDNLVCNDGFQDILTATKAAFAGVFAGTKSDALMRFFIRIGVQVSTGQKHMILWLISELVLTAWEMGIAGKILQWLRSKMTIFSAWFTAGVMNHNVDYDKPFHKCNVYERLQQVLKLTEPNGESDVDNHDDYAEFESEEPEESCMVMRAVKSVLSMVKTFGATIVCVFSSLMPEGVVVPQALKGLIKNITMIGAGMKAVGTIGSAVSYIWTKFKNVMFKMFAWISGDTYVPKDVAVKADIKKWTENVNELRDFNIQGVVGRFAHYMEGPEAERLMKHPSGTICVTDLPIRTRIFYMNYLRDLAREGAQHLVDAEVYLKRNIDCQDAQTMKEFLTVNLQWLNQRLQQETLKFSASSGSVRFRPVVVGITGAPGVGKTKGTEMLTKYAGLTMGYREKDLDRFIHEAVYFVPKDPNVKFWNGYNQRPVLRFEETFDRVYSATNPNPFVHQLYELASEAEYNIPAAHLNDKNQCFQGDYIFFTTNHRGGLPLTADAGGHKDPRGFKRRCDLYMDQSVSPTYADDEGELDLNKVNNSEIADSPELAYVFKMINPITGEPVTEWTNENGVQEKIPLEFNVMKVFELMRSRRAYYYKTSTINKKSNLLTKVPDGMKSDPTVKKDESAAAKTENKEKSKAPTLQQMWSSATVTNHGFVEGVTEFIWGKNPSVFCAEAAPKPNKNTGFQASEIHVLALHGEDVYYFGPHAIGSEEWRTGLYNATVAYQRKDYDQFFAVYNCDTEVATPFAKDAKPKWSELYNSETPHTADSNFKKVCEIHADLPNVRMRCSAGLVKLGMKTGSKATVNQDGQEVQIPEMCMLAYSSKRHFNDFQKTTHTSQGVTSENCIVNFLRSAPLQSIAEAALIKSELRELEVKSFTPSFIFSPLCADYLTCTGDCGKIHPEGILTLRDHLVFLSGDPTYASWQGKKMYPHYPHANNRFKATGSLGDVDKNLMIRYQVTHDDLCTDIYRFKDTDQIRKSWSVWGRYRYNRMLYALGPSLSKVVTHPLVVAFTKIAAIIGALFAGGLAARYLFGKLSDLKLKRDDTRNLLTDYPEISEDYNQAGVMGKLLMAWGFKSLGEPADSVLKARRAAAAAAEHKTFPVSSDAMISLDASKPVSTSLREILMEAPHNTEIPEKYGSDLNVGHGVAATLNNLFSIQYLNTSGVWRTSANLLFVTDVYAISAAHVAFGLVNGLRNGIQHRIVSHAGTKYMIRAGDFEVKAFDKEGKDMRDLAGIKFSRYIAPGRRSILKRFTNNPECFGIHPSWRLQASLEPGNEKMVEIVPSDLVVTPMEQRRPIDWRLDNYDGTLISSRAYISTTCDGKPGNSGSPVVANMRSASVDVSGTIAGIYAGHGLSHKIGIVIPVTRREIEANIESFRVKGCDIWEVTYVDWPADVFTRKITMSEAERILSEEEEFGHATITGAIDRTTQGTNDRVPSFIHKVFPVTKRPAKMVPFRTRSGEKLEPRNVRTKTYTRVPTHVDPVKVKKTLRHVMNRHLRLMQKELGRDDFRVLTPHAAHYGIEGRKFVNGLKGKSSPGFFTKEAVETSRGVQISTNKEYKSVATETIDYLLEFFSYDTEGSHDAYPKEYGDFVRDAIRKFKNNERLMIPSVDTLKSETIANEKVEQGKTRIISAYSDVRFVVLFRQLFGTVLEGFFECAPRNGFAIGLNPFSADVDEAFDHVTRHGTNTIIAGDHSGFDTRAPHVVLTCMVDALVEAFFPRDDPNLNRFRKYVWLEVSENHHISDGLVWFPEHGMPSGNPATLLVNCLKNEVGLRLTYEMSCEDAGLPTRNSNVDFDHVCSWLVCGDDNVFSVSQVVKPYFNQFTITKNFAKLGYVYTDENKQEATSATRNIYEVSFLKRRWIPDGYNRHHMLLDMDTIKNMCNWVSDDFAKQVGLMEATRVSAEAAFREACFYGDAIAESIYAKVRRAFEVAGGTFTTVPREPMLVRHGLRTGSLVASNIQHQDA